MARPPRKKRNVKQILQNPGSGALELVEVPTPRPGRGQILVRNAYSVVSPGTEKLAMDFAQKSLLGKARSRPDLVKQVVRKIRQEGPLPTYRTVTNRLDAPQPLGYSSAGVVEDVGSGVIGFAKGDRVACAGAGYANHAEWIVVPENLAVRVPESVALDKAAFATLGAIAMQGIRVAQPTLGETAAVIGLGLIGQLAVQLLRANGCRVLGVDVDPGRATQAEAQGAEWALTVDADFDAWRTTATGGHGVDLSLVAAASDSSAPIQLSAELCRMKGRVIAIGATQMHLDRRTFYDKELDLRMSMSYGPGRYDRSYEEGGNDYPIAYVRWTENRNLDSFLHLIAAGSVDPALLDTESLPFEDALAAYDSLAKGERRNLAVVFRYSEAAQPTRSVSLKPKAAGGRDVVGVGVIGAGNYAKAVLLPALGGLEGVRPVGIVTASGASARRTGERFGFEDCSTDPEHVLANPDVDLVIVATQHDTHAELAERALRAGKAVWLEKPIGLSQEEVDAVIEAARETGNLLAVGYNRRFSKHAAALKNAFAGTPGPVSIHYAVSPGPPPTGSWAADPATGGGRIVGEVCHFVDLLIYLTGAEPSEVIARAAGRDPAVDDSIAAILTFPNGSIATIQYLAHASTDLPKEVIRVSGAGRTLECDNFRSTHAVGQGRSGSLLRTLNQDKGQASALEAVVEAVRKGEPSPFRLEELAATSRATFAMGNGAS